MDEHESDGTPQCVEGEINVVEEPFSAVAEKPESVVEDGMATQDQAEEKEEEAKPKEEAKPEEEAKPKEEAKPEEEVVMKSTRPRSPKRSQIYTIDPAIPNELDIGLEGISATEPLAIGHLLQQTKEKYPEHLAMVDKNGESLEVVTYKEYYDFCIRAAKSFLKLELEPRCAVGLMGSGAPELFISCLGAVFANGIACSMFSTFDAETCEYVAKESNMNIAVVENDHQLQKFLQIREQLPNLKAIIQYKGSIKEPRPDDVYEWEQFLQLGDSIENKVVEDKIYSQRTQNCALITFSADGTGKLKGVMLSHDNITWMCEAFSCTYKGFINRGCERFLSYLPLGDITNLQMDMFISMYIAGTTFFVPPETMMNTVTSTLRDVQPTIFVGHPRVWKEILKEKQQQSRNPGGLKKRLSLWARAKGMQGNKNIQNNNESLPFGWSVADKLIFQKVRERLGLNHCKLAMNYSAPLPQQVQEYFMAINISIVDCWGMTEGTGVIATNVIKPRWWRIGSMGKPLSGVRVRIDKPTPATGIGQICFRGRNLMMGYLNDLEQTKEAIDEEGWMHTGELGKFDEEGFLCVYGRMTDMLTVEGETFNPTSIENEILSEIPFLGHAMAVGDGRQYLTCLLTMRNEVDMETCEPLDRLTPESVKAVTSLGSSATMVSQVIEHQDRAVFSFIEETLKKINDKASSPAHKIKRWTLLDTGFSIAGGELGPNMTMQRSKIKEKYAETIDALYADAAK